MVICSKDRINVTSRLIRSFLFSENPSTILSTKPLNKEPHAKLKKTMEPFHQDGSCTEVTPKLMKCRECKMTPNQRNKNINVPNIFCRFYAFRR